MMRIKIDEVKVGTRKRKLDEERVRELAESIRELGLLQPIGIREDGTLVFGWHRLEACRLLGWDEIEALLVHGADGLRAELAEIDENLIRNELTALERAEHLARRKQIYEQLHPLAKPELQRLKGLKPFRTSGDTVSPLVDVTQLQQTDTFVSDTAKKTGLSERSIQRDIQIATRIAAEVRDAIRETPLADSKRDLLRLARLDAERQREVAERVRSGETDIRRLLRSSSPQPNPELHGQYEGIEIRTGDFRVVLADIPDRSVDIILTDPPYPKEYLPLWRDLAVFAARVLKPTGVLVAYSGQMYLPDILGMMCEQLKWWWLGCVRHTGNCAMVVVGGRRILNQFKPLLIFVPQDSKGLDYGFTDVIEGSGADKSLHNWQQPVDEAKQILSMFGSPGCLVVDPFAGSGSFGQAAKEMGMRFVGAELLEVQQ